MDLIGSKERLNEWLFGHIRRRLPNGLNGRTFLDACCGSASVSRYAASLGFHVTATDLMAFPVALANGSICDNPAAIEEACRHLDRLKNIKPVDGLFRREYSPAAKAVAGGRPFFTEENAGRLDACRQYIGKLTDAKVRDILLYFLIEAMSRVSNTMGTHGAFKKIGSKGEGWKDRALDPLTPKREDIVSGQVVALRKDVLEFFKEWSGKPVDVVYIDPPYNSRQYAANYHLYENFVIYDNPTVHGKTGLRDWQREAKSAFCSQKVAMDFLVEVVTKAPSSLVFVSYSSDGLLSEGRSPQAIADRLMSVVECRCVTVHMRGQRRYVADSSRENEDSALCEYLFEVEK